MISATLHGEEASHLTQYWEINHSVGSHQFGDGLDTVTPLARHRADMIISHLPGPVLGLLTYNFIY